MTGDIEIKARKLKVTVPVPAGSLDLDAVPPEGPAPDLRLVLSLEGSPWSIQARLSGKSYRRLAKSIRQQGADNVTVILQGDLVPSPDGQGLTLDSTGFSATPRTPKPDPEGAPGA